LKCQSLRDIDPSTTKTKNSYQPTWKPDWNTSSN
jgi:hypothetical protein